MDILAGGKAIGEEGGKKSLREEKCVSTFAKRRGTSSNAQGN